MLSGVSANGTLSLLSLCKSSLRPWTAVAYDCWICWWWTKEWCSRKCRLGKFNLEPPTLMTGTQARRKRPPRPSVSHKSSTVQTSPGHKGYCQSPDGDQARLIILGEYQWSRA
ncbi:hypothetical protein BKA70DRAFT_1241010 [Coprinopsis sp. MPI-PUGE-AT-0042]|nr:hypothetical protein BKA70DRAFT_1241010 [Coprinopsis sp. MPI-PUGE-AT-0042]